MSRRRSAETQYTIRQVPAAVDDALRRRAKSLGQSLNHVALDALARGAGIDAEPVRYKDLDGFFGSWVRDPAVDRALAEQRTIDDALWK